MVAKKEQIKQRIDRVNAKADIFPCGEERLPVRETKIRIKS
jgi:hypothetical protein